MDELPEDCRSYGGTVADNREFCDQELEPLKRQIMSLCKSRGIPVLIAIECAPQETLCSCAIPEAACDPLKYAAMHILGEIEVMGGILVPGSANDSADDESDTEE